VCLSGEKGVMVECVLGVIIGSVVELGSYKEWSDERPNHGESYLKDVRGTIQYDAM
jgi:hypothetical protein